MRVTSLSYLAEYLATFLFVLVILVSHGHPMIIGATLGLIIFLTASMSGGHLNPAVSLAMWFHQKLQTSELMAYIAAQLMGGASAYYAYKMI